MGSITNLEIYAKENNVPIIQKPIKTLQEISQKLREIGESFSLGESNQFSQIVESFRADL